VAVSAQEKNKMKRSLLVFTPAAIPVSSIIYAATPIIHHKPGIFNTSTYSEKSPKTNKTLNLKNRNNTDKPGRWI